jgi:hypothetical protein
VARRVFLGEVLDEAIPQREATKRVRAMLSILSWQNGAEEGKKKGIETWGCEGSGHQKAVEKTEGVGKNTIAG